MRLTETHQEKSEKKLMKNMKIMLIRKNELWAVLDLNSSELLLVKNSKSRKNILKVRMVVKLCP